MWRMRPRKFLHAGESTSTPADMRQLRRKGVKHDWKDENAEKAADSSSSVTSASPRSHLHCSKRVQCAAWTSACLLGQDWTAGETNCCIVEVTPKDILDQSAALSLRGRDVLTQDVLATAAQHCDVAVSKFEKYLRVKERFMGPKNSSTTVSLGSQACAH